MMHVAEVPLAVVDPREATEYNEFGWTLADGERDILLAQLPRLLRLGGVGRLKFPAWTAAEDDARLDELTRLADALRRNGVSIVGLLSLPPADVRAKCAEGTVVDDPVSLSSGFDTVSTCGQKLAMVNPETLARTRDVDGPVER